MFGGSRGCPQANRCSVDKVVHRVVHSPLWTSGCPQPCPQGYPQVGDNLWITPSRRGEGAGPGLRAVRAWLVLRATLAAFPHPAAPPAARAPTETKTKSKRERKREMKSETKRVEQTRRAGNRAGPTRPKRIRRPRRNPQPQLEPQTKSILTPSTTAEAKGSPFTAAAMQERNPKAPASPLLSASIPARIATARGSRRPAAL